MKLELLLLASVFGLFYYCFPVDFGHCSEVSGAQTLSTDINSHHDKPLKKRRNHEMKSVMNEGSEEERVFISSSQEEDVMSVTTAHDSDSFNPTEMLSCSNVEVDESKSIITRESVAACDETEKLQYDPSVSRFNVDETEKPIKTNKDKTGKGTNVSHILNKQGGNISPEIDPSPLRKDQEIPTFDEWTKIMMEEENEKSQSSRVSNGKKIQQTFTNYASVECGAKILSSNPEAKSTSAILMENMDMYMLNPCNNKIWFIIELCQPIQVRQLDIANFEIFSSNPKDFLVSISDRYPTNRWLKLGTFHARDERTVQSFPLDEHLFAKYIKVELLSHFGSEHFCPLSMVRVFGTSMMEEYEMNSDSSDRPHSRDDQDYDESSDFVPLYDKSTKNLIGSAKDVLLTMVNNIAANVLGGNPDNTAGEGGNDSTEDLNVSEISLLTQPISFTSSAVSETVVVDGLVNETTVITSIPRETGPHKIESTFTGLLSEDPTAHAKDLHIHPDIQQIVTLLPDDDDGESDRSSDENLKRLKTNQLKCHVNVSRSSFSLQEYLLQRCSSQSIIQKKKKMKPVSCSLLPQTKHFISTTIMPFAIQPTTIANEQTSSEDLLTWTETLPVAEMFESRIESGSMNLEPSLTSNFLKPSADFFKVTHPIELQCLSFSECLKLKIPSKKPLQTSLSQLTVSTAEKTGGDHQINLENDISTLTVSLNVVDPSQLVSSSALVDDPVPKQSKDETVPDVLMTPTQPIHPIDGSTESKSKDLFDDAMLETKGITSEIDTEMHNSSDVPMHGSNQKESVFMRLNNRIKVLEMNMSLSGRYLEQLSQRYRKQVDEMQRAFNQTVIKLQNTSRVAEEQDQKQTDSIQILQIQLENVTRLLLGLSVSVSQLQEEVSERQSYIVLCLVLCVIIGLLICCNHHQILCDTADSDTFSYPNRVDYYEDVFVRRRASDPLSQSSFQIPAGVEEMDSPKQGLHSPLSKKKQHQLKLIKSSEQPTSSVVNSSPASAHGISQCTVGSQGLNILCVDPGPLLVTRDVMMSDVGSSKSDETLFCGLSTCVSLCEALPAPKCWTEEKTHEHQDTRTSAEHLHQIPQCTAPLPGLGPTLNLH